MVQTKEIQYKNFGKCMEITNGKASVTVTVDVGPRIIACSVPGRTVEPVPMSLLVQMGMLGCPLFFAIVFYRVFLNLVRLPQQFRNDDIMVFLEIVTVMNFVVAFFEGGGFLGPGQTTMPLWLLAGYFDAGAQISASQSDAAAENAE